MAAPERAPLMEVKGSSRGTVQAVEVALRVLEALIALDGPATLGSIAAKAAITPSGLHRYMVTFVRSGIAVQLDSGEYDLGPTLRRYGIAALRRLDPFRIVSDRVARLRDETNCTVFLAVWADEGATILRWEEGNEHVPMRFRLGSRIPLSDTATGRLFLALLPTRLTALVWDKLPKRTALIMKLEEIRREGMSWTEGGLAPGLNAYAAPVYDHQGDVYGALTLLVPTAQARQAKASIAKLRSAAMETSLTLGYQPKPRAAARNVKRTAATKAKKKTQAETTA
jgi:DNA-binding IclR family transcriptional regulator